MPCRLLSIPLADRTLEATTLDQVMKLTTGAVECLSRGAAHNDPDANAVGPNGDLFEAGQMVTEGDAELRRSLDKERSSGNPEL